MMQIAPTPIDGAAVVRSDPHEDERGAFARLYCSEELKAMTAKPVVQINFSRTLQSGAVRGMHLQLPPDQEVKFVRCLRGRVFDVVVDLRQGSTTFLQWFGVELSADQWNMMVVPEGCAHGFQALESGCEMLYLHTASYAPQSESGVRYDDPAIGIIWPLVPTQVSRRDRGHPLIDDSFEGVAP